MNLVYHSTRNSEETATASEAILKGLTSDGGLFVPDSIPKLNVALEDLTKMSDIEPPLIPPGKPVNQTPNNLPSSGLTKPIPVRPSNAPASAAPVPITIQ